MKSRLLLAFLLLLMPLAPVGWTGMTCAKNNQAAYQTIGAAEQAVLAANGAYLDKVVTGALPTNSVPSVEKAFNDVQLALHAAAAASSGGTSTPAPLTLQTQAAAFVNMANPK